MACYWKRKLTASRLETVEAMKRLPNEFNTMEPGAGPQAPAYYLLLQRLWWREDPCRYCTWRKQHFLLWRQSRAPKGILLQHLQICWTPQSSPEKSHVIIQTTCYKNMLIPWYKDITNLNFSVSVTKCKCAAREWEVQLCAEELLCSTLWWFQVSFISGEL